MEPQFTTVTRGLEMLLDQLYYWARRAVEQRREGGDREIADRMLNLATENLERFVASLLDCFRAIQLDRTPVRTSDLVAALVRRARDDIAATSVVVQGDAETTVHADMVQLERAWSAIVRRLGPGPGPVEVTVAPTRTDRPGLEIVVNRSGTASSLAGPDVTMELEWALALRIIELHGWELREETRPRARAVVVFLPAE